MPDDPQELYVCRVLSKDELQRSMYAIPEFFLQRLGDCILTAQYGWGCNLHASLCYTEMEVGITRLSRFLTDSIRQEIVVLGHSDLLISVPENRMTILFCHEGDIHTHGKDEKLQQELWSSDPFRTFELVRHPPAPSDPAAPSI